MQKSEKELFAFTLFTNEQRLENKRVGETKLSEKIRFGVDTSACQFVILGISEDIGPQMNNGLPGAHKGFGNFVQALQSVQSNRFLDGSQIGFLGEITQLNSFDFSSSCKGWVEDLDHFIEAILTKYVHENQQLIAIGGGHNNAYPLIKFTHSITNQKVQSINIDPHADCRTTEFRHSGNPFSSAINEKLLDNYAVFGLHEGYNNEFILKYLQENKVYSLFFEKFIDDEVSWWQSWNEYYARLSDDLPVILDIDLDAIQFSPSSALTPSGFTIEQIRKMIRQLSSKKKVNILHLPEGAPRTEEELRLYGKMLAYFVQDFIKGQNA
jgi:formiminoglutamase